MPVPAIHVVPPLVLYCQAAPGSSPLKLTVPLLVIPSLADAPVSLTSATTGATGGVWSTVTAPSAAGAPVLPAASVWRTSIAPAP